MIDSHNLRWLPEDSLLGRNPSQAECLSPPSSRAAGCPARPPQHSSRAAGCPARPPQHSCRAGECPARPPPPGRRGGGAVGSRGRGRPISRTLTGRNSAPRSTSVSSGEISSCHPFHPLHHRDRVQEGHPGEVAHIPALLHQTLQHLQDVRHRAAERRVSLAPALTSSS